MRFLLIALFAILTTAAHADATITITLTGAGAANTTRTLIVSDANGARVMTWARNTFDCVPGTPLPNCTNQQAVNRVFGRLLDTLRSHVIDYERIVARDGVPASEPQP